MLHTRNEAPPQSAAIQKLQCLLSEKESQLQETVLIGKTLLQENETLRATHPRASPKTTPRTQKSTSALLDSDYIDSLEEQNRDQVHQLHLLRKQ